MLPAIRTVLLGSGRSFYGPGDLVPGSSSWWGLRAYSRAYARNGGPCMDIVRTSDGGLTKTINVRKDGSLDTATIASLGYAVSVSKLYDQTGNGHHMLQATLANMPTLTLNGLGTRPIMNFNGTSTRMDESGTLTISNPFTISNVFFSTNQGGRIWRITAGACGHNAANANQLIAFATANNITLNITDSAYHTWQAVFNGASSDNYVDGTANTGDTGTVASAAYTQTLGTNGTSFLNGKILEAGIWLSALSTGNKAALHSNQRAYWGL